MPGKGKMTVTGNLRDVMKESIQAANAYVRSRSIEFGIHPSLFEKKDKPDDRTEEQKTKDKRARVQPVVEPDGQLAPLRQLCRLRGIELPYRPSWEHGKRAGGFAAAVERAVGTGRPDMVIVISDLAGLAEDDTRAIRAIARLRKAAGSVVVLAPSPSAFLPPVASVHGRRVRELMVRDARAAIEPGRRLLIRHGVTVVEGSPADSLDRLISNGRVRLRAG